MASISVVIRNKNEAENLRLVLARLRRQHTQPEDIIVVDNDSEDESRKYIKEFDATLVHLPAASFSYGRATNLGFEHCSTDLVLMLSSHSLPIGRHFIDDVCEPFTDPRVAGVRIPIASNTSELRKTATYQPLDQNSSAEEVFRRGPVASGSVLLHAAWLEYRFDESIQAAEDKEWALRVLRSGKYIMTVADAAYCYNKSFSSDGWLRKIKQEEAAGAAAASILPPASLKTFVKKALVSQRDVFKALAVELELYQFRRSLRRRTPKNGHDSPK
jgi:rhamnosyltransferase